LPRIATPHGPDQAYIFEVGVRAADKRKPSRFGALASLGPWGANPTARRADTPRRIPVIARVRSTRRAARSADGRQGASGGCASRAGGPSAVRSLLARAGRRSIFA